MRLCCHGAEALLWYKGDMIELRFSCGKDLGMINREEYMESYRRLQKISEYDADIYASEDYEELLLASGLGTRTENLGANIQMQLAEGAFRRTAGEALKNFETLNMRDRQSRFIRETMRRKLSLYSPEERRAVLIDMIEACAKLAGAPLGEQDCLRLTQKTSDELEEQLVDAITQLSFVVMEKGETDNLWQEEEYGDWNVSESSTFSAGAGCGAAYLHGGALREYPETIGTVTGAASALSDSLDQTEGADAVEIMASVLLMISASVIITILFSASLGAGALMASMAVESGAAVTLAGLADCFVSCVSLFAVELKIAVGAGISGLIAGAIAFIKEHWRNRKESASEYGALTDALAEQRELYGEEYKEIGCGSFEEDDRADEDREDEENHIEIDDREDEDREDDNSEDEEDDYGEEDDEADDNEDDNSEDEEDDDI